MTDKTDITDKTQFIYKDLTFKLIGLAYEVFNSLGSDMKEASYKKAYALLLDKEEIKYSKEHHYPLKIRDQEFAKRFFDFLIDDKIIVEFKNGSKAYLDTYKQLLEYLRVSNYKLGLIIRFTVNGVKVKRIPNIY